MSQAGARSKTKAQGGPNDLVQGTEDPIASAAQAGGEFARHVAGAGGRRPTTARPLTRGGSTGAAMSAPKGGMLTLALGASLAWWGLRHGGLLGTAGLFIGGWAAIQAWPEVMGE
jgi:hypothetical protein